MRESKTEQILTRCTKAEKKRWRKRAKQKGHVRKDGDANMSDYIRDLLLEDEEKRP